MEYNINNKKHNILLSCKNAEIKEENGNVKLIANLKEKFEFELNIKELKVRVDNEKLIIFDNEDDHYIVYSPVIKCDKNEYDSMYDVSLNDGKLRFILKCDDEKCNENHIVETIIETLIQKENKTETSVQEEKDKDVVFNFETKEMLVRKKVTRFIEKLLEHVGYRVDYSHYKSLIYREKVCDDEYEMEIKNIYDAYVYLITDYKNIMSEYRFRRFYYLLVGKEIDDNTLMRIVDFSFQMRDEEYTFKAASILKLGLELFDSSDNKIERMIPFMLMNYELIRSGIPSTMILYRDYEFFKTINKNNENKLREFVEKIVRNNKYQERKYYEELCELDFQNLKETILKDKEILVNKYNITHISAFGSFSKGKERIDSDIDLAVEFSLDVTSDVIEETIDFIKNKYFEKFHRYIDVMRIFENGTDETRLLSRFAKEIF